MIEITKEGKVKLKPQVLPFKELLRAIAANTEEISRIMKMKFIYLTLITGRGLEFEKLREYTPQDDARLIDWKATARLAKPFVKVYKEERMLDVIVLLDVSNTMLLGTTEYLKNEYALIVAGILANAALMAGDLVGILAFSDARKLFYPPSGREDQLYIALKMLTQERYYGGRKDWRVLINLLPVLRKETVLIVISDFIGTLNDPFFQEFVSFAAERVMRVIGFMVRDPVDSRLPKGVGKMVLRDPVTGEIMLVDVDKIREKYEAEAAREEKFVEEKFRAANAPFIKTYTNKSFVQTFVKVLEGYW